MQTLQAEATEELRRLERFRRQAADLREPRAAQVLDRIDHEEIVQDLRVTLDAARNDPDAADKAQNRLLDLKSALDELKYALEWPALQLDTRDTLAQLIELAERQGTSRDKQQAEVYARELQRAIASESSDAVWLQVRDIRQSLAELHWRDPRDQRRVLTLLETLRAEMRDPGLADRLIHLANQAATEHDWSGLRSALHQLIGLLPAEKRGHLPGYGGMTLT